MFHLARMGDTNDIIIQQTCMITQDFASYHRIGVRYNRRNRQSQVCSASISAREKIITQARLSFRRSVRDNARAAQISRTTCADLTYPRTYTQKETKTSEDKVSA